MEPPSSWIVEGKYYFNFLSGKDMPSQMKRGVYMPVRTHFSKTIAIMCTFLASGLVHEWILTVVFYFQSSDKDINGYCSSCFHPHMYGKTLYFSFGMVY